MDRPRLPARLTLPSLPSPPCGSAGEGTPGPRRATARRPNCQCTWSACVSQKHARQMFHAQRVVASNHPLASETPANEHRVHGVAITLRRSRSCRGLAPGGYVRREHALRRFLLLARGTCNPFARLAEPWHAQRHRKIPRSRVAPEKAAFQTCNWPGSSTSRCPGALGWA